jgi:TLD.
LRIFQYDSSTRSTPSDTAVKAVVDSVISKTSISKVSTYLESENGTVQWWHLISFLKQNLIYVNRALKFYWASKFLQKTFSIKLPELTKNSFILERDVLGLLYLSNVYLQSISKLHHLYSTSINGFSFEKLCKILSIVNNSRSNWVEDYEGPTLLLFSATPARQTHRSGSGEDLVYTFGGFTRLRWKDGPEYHGDSDCYIFSIAPKFHNFFALSTPNADTNYLYLNSSGYGPIGLGNTPYLSAQILGFGGSMNNDFRIWVDGRDPGESYVHSEDNTYESGYLTDPRQSQLRVIFWIVSL